MFDPLQWRLAPGFLLAALLASAAPAVAQHRGLTPGVRTAPAPHITLRADPRNVYTSVRARAHAGKGARATATFIVEYEGFPADAQTAFQYAVDVWSTLISSPVPIRIRAVWQSLDPGTLGSAGPTRIFSDFDAGLPGTWYPSALADALAGEDLQPGEADIVANFNSLFSNWHFGTSGKPASDQYDFVTVVMHEIGHGLGFIGSMRVDDGAGAVECGGVAGEGCWGFDGYAGVPMVYDRLVADGAGRPLTDAISFATPSAGLGTALRSGALFFSGAASESAHGSQPPVYAPSTWESGSSFSHLDEATFLPGNESSLMTPLLAMAEVVHDAGNVGCGVMADLGWMTTEYCGATGAAPPPPPPPPLPGAPVAVLPLSEDINVELFASLVWRAVDLADAYEVELGTGVERSIVFHEAALSDTSVAVPALAEDTEYAWRVRASNVSGAGEWSEVRTFRTYISPPGAVRLTAPESGATDVAVKTRLQWDAAERAASYRVIAGTDSDLVVPEITVDSLSQTYLDLDALRLDERYYWRVQAVNRNGAGPWSAQSSFLTVPPPPASPVASAPGDGASGLSVPVTTTWSRVDAATSYVVQIADTWPIPDNAPAYETADTSWVHASLVAGTTYYWFVRAGNAGGGSRWSVTRQFTTEAALPDAPEAAPETLVPARGTTIAGTTVELKWSAVEGASTYEVQMDESLDFDSVSQTLTGLTGTSAVVEGVPRGQRHYWRVRAGNAGGAGSWSTPSVFETLPLPPSAPTSTAPSEGSAFDSAYVRLVWNDTSNGDGYHIQLATDLKMRRLVAEDSLLTNPAFTYAAGGGSGARFWRVRARNDAGWGDWSEIRSFVLMSATGTEGTGLARFSLHQNYPNPFNPTTTIRYEIAVAGRTRLSIFDMAGRRIAVLVDAPQTAGVHEIQFDAGALPSGTYLYRLQSGEQTAVGRMVLVK